MPYATARLGSGSDVLGLDDVTSRDHDWGLRLTLLVPQDHVDVVDHHLDDVLPDSFAGHPTRFPTTWKPDPDQQRGRGTAHQVHVTTAEGLALSRLGLDPGRGLAATDWLCLTGQSVLEVTAGPVFADTAGTITRLRRTLAWYPDDVWAHVVAADWERLSQDLPLLGRTRQRGDHLGTHALTGRIIGTCLHLAFLLARRWPPYPKWLGTLAATLPLAERLTPHLTAAATAASAVTGPHRPEALAEAVRVLHDAQRATGLPTGAHDPIEPFYDRPYPGLRAEVPRLLLSTITDPVLRALPPTGSVEQWIDNVILLTDPPLRVATARAYLQRHLG